MVLKKGNWYKLAVTTSSTANIKILMNYIMILQLIDFGNEKTWTDNKDLEIIHGNDKQFMRQKG